MTTSFCSTHLDVSTSWLVQKRTKMNSQNGDDLMELYKKVAEQDPEWYQEFVTDVLKDESLLPSSLLKQEESNSNENREGFNLNTPSLQETSNEADIYNIDEDFETNDDKDTTIDELTIGEDLRKQQAIINIENETMVGNIRVVREKARSDMETKKAKPATMENDINDSLAAEIMSEGHNAKPDSDSIVDTEESRKRVNRHNHSVEMARKAQETNNVTERIEFANSNITEQVIVYRDLSTNGLLTNPVEVVAKLGYDVQVDIPVLKADVMALIIENSMQKPARGIPSHWKITRNEKNLLKDSVRVVSVEESKQILKLEAERQTHSAVDKEQAKESKRQGEGDSKQQEVPRKAMRSISGVQETSMKQQQYSGTRGDPPPPPGPLWVDINTFRGLLRRENEFRINILGDAWKDTVKMEGKWRLGLYKQWLWALSNGRDVGIVPTRLPPRSSSTTSSLVKRSSRRTREPEEWRPILDPRNPPRYSSRERDAARRRGSKDTRKSRPMNDNQRE
eukprot:CAMPEP_0194225582 /NCGR_PEP_ID=MMETSP0156-20130528/39939_1 /TAXON_ID=33649 /ORGANISM="Thalassionema nitzschioides, Strain L26-B" /LENGTH=508 /DNA_ID=CAMNT_0038957593 /DNA_START=210 /DNA_END=1736 /DNA_ORIENTATION=+